MLIDIQSYEANALCLGDREFCLPVAEKILSGLYFLIFVYHNKEGTLLIDEKAQR